MKLSEKWLIDHDWRKKLGSFTKRFGSNRCGVTVFVHRSKWHTPDDWNVCFTQISHNSWPTLIVTVGQFTRLLKCVMDGKHKSY